MFRYNMRLEEEMEIVIKQYKKLETRIKAIEDAQRNIHYMISVLAEILLSDIGEVDETSPILNEKLSGGLITSRKNWRFWKSG